MKTPEGGRERGLSKRRPEWRTAEEKGKKGRKGKKMTLIQLDGWQVPFPETGNTRRGPRWERGDHEVSLGFRVSLGQSSRATRGHVDISEK